MHVMRSIKYIKELSIVTSAEYRLVDIFLMDVKQLIAMTCSFNDEL